MRGEVIQHNTQHELPAIPSASTDVTGLHKATGLTLKKKKKKKVDIWGSVLGFICLQLWQYKRRS